MRRSGSTINVLLAVGVALIVISVFVFRGGSPSGGAPSSPQSAAEAFAGAYVRYLGGQIPLTQLPDASAGVLRTANGIIVPRRLRAGQLTLAALRMTALSGSTASAVFAARDGRRFLPTSITLSHRAGNWVVVGLIPPDFSELDSPPKTPPAPSAAQTAASIFALAYVDYREGVRRELPSGLPLIAQEIAGGQDPLAHTAPLHKAAHLDSLRLGPVTNGTVAATAQLSDGGTSIGVLFILQKGSGGWAASQFIVSG